MTTNQEEYIKQLERENELLKKKLENMRRPAPINIQTLVYEHSCMPPMFNANSMDFIETRMLREVAEKLREYIIVDRFDRSDGSIKYRFTLHIHRQSQDEM